MTAAAVVISILLAVLVAVSAEGKLRRRPRQVAVMEHVGVPLDRMWMLAVPEVAAVGGLLVGLAWWPLAAAAAAGLMLYFAAALGAHFRAKDYDLAPAGMMLALSVAAFVTVVLAH